MAGPRRPPGHEAKDLGAKAKAKNLYLFGWGKEAATYYQTTLIASAIKEGGDEVRLALDNIQPKLLVAPGRAGRVHASLRHHRRPAT